jgi:hypothetical protein
MLSIVSKRDLAAFVAALALVLVPTTVMGQESDIGGENVLVLSSEICGQKYADSPRMSTCLAQQNAKADRWMAAIVESYARMAEEAMSDLAHGGVPFDQVAQLHKSQAAFGSYRSEAAELVGRTGLPGMGIGLTTAMAYFDLTVERARFLLDTCNGPLNRKLTDQVDLTVVDWCPSGL